MIADSAVLEISPLNLVYPELGQTLGEFRMKSLVDGNKVAISSDLIRFECLILDLFFIKEVAENVV